MTVGLIEGLIIFLVVLVVIALAFRTGISRGRRQAARSGREQPHDPGASD